MSNTKVLLDLYEKHKEDLIVGDPTGEMKPDAYEALLGAISTFIVLGVHKGEHVTKTSIRDKTY